MGIEETTEERGSCLKSVIYSEGNGLDDFEKCKRRTATDIDPRTNL